MTNAKPFDKAKYLNMAFNGFVWGGLNDDGTHFFVRETRLKNPPYITYAEMRCTEEMLTNGDAEFMSLHGLTYTGKARKPKPIAAIKVHECRYLRTPAVLITRAVVLIGLLCVLGACGRVRFENTHHVKERLLAQCELAYKPGELGVTQGRYLILCMQAKGYAFSNMVPQPDWCTETSLLTFQYTDDDCYKYMDDE